jgi:hypothetical protein
MALLKPLSNLFYVNKNTATKRNRGDHGTLSCPTRSLSESVNSCAEKDVVKVEEGKAI